MCKQRKISTLQDDKVDNKLFSNLQYSFQLKWNSCWCRKLSHSSCLSDFCDFYFMKCPMTEPWPSAFSTSVALQISHEALSAEMLTFYYKHSQQWGYKEERPWSLCQFFSFCLVRPDGGCAPSSSWCSKFDSKQRFSKWARLKYYPQMHTFTWTVTGSFNALPLTCAAASVTLTPFTLCVM